MWFANRLFLVGLAGAAIPILIHLLTRDRIRRVAFSTMRFFAKASRNVLRRKRLQEAILVAMRALACALLALAFARPFFAAARDGGPETVTADTAAAIVVDLSGSMGRAGMEQALREEALSALNDLSEARDAAALIAFADAPLVAQPLTRKLGEVRARIGLLSPGHGGTNIAEAVHQADVVLRSAAARKKQVVLVSDLQRTGWHGVAPDGKLSPGVELVIRQVAPAKDEGNLAIVEADVPHSTVAGPAPQPLAVRVKNFGPDERRDVAVTLRIQDKDVATEKLNLRPGADVAARFRYAFERAGDNPGTVTLAADDAMAEDNVLYFNARVIPRIRVLLVNGSPVTGPRGNAAYFIERALVPGELSAFQVTTVPAAKATAADVAAALVVILSDVTEVPEPAAKALAGLLERGGGLLFLPGQAVEADAFNRVFGELAPCRLTRKLAPRETRGRDAPPTADGGSGEAALAKVDYEHPIFDIFPRPHHGDLTLPKFTHFWEVTDSQLSRVLARFDDGRPAVLERQLGAGTSMMLVSSPDMVWSDFPLRAVFLPTLHQMVRYLAVRTEGRAQFQVGDRLPVPEGCKLKDPQDKVRDGKDAVAAEPGFYAVLDADGKETFLFAVNRSAAEADTATVGPAEITAALVRAEGEAIEEGRAAGEEPKADAGKADEADRAFWWYVMVAVAALSVGELVLGNHTLRH